MLADVSLAMAFLAGLAGFLAPCALVLLPLFLVLLTGAGLLTSFSSPRGVLPVLLLAAVAFVLAFGAAFVASWSWPELFQGRGPATPVVNRAGGVLLILVGLVALGLLGRGWQGGLRSEARRRGAASGLSLAAGGVFALGWTPCVGSTLGQILSLAAGPQGGAAAVLMAVYAAGLMLPFLALGWGMGWALRWLVQRKRLARWATLLTGALFILLGVVVFTGNLRELTGYLYALNPGLLLL